MTIDIDAIRKREQAATPGPWGVGNGTFIASELKRLDNGSIQYRHAVAELDEFAREESDYPNPVAPEADAEFIAHARQDIPALLAELDELREQAKDSAYAAEQARQGLTEARAQVAELADQLHKANAQIHSLEQATTAYANENDRLRRERGEYAEDNRRVAAQVAQLMHDLETSKSIAKSNARNFATLAEVIERVAKFADELEGYCSPHGVSVTYARRLRAVLNGPTEVETGVAK